MPIPIFSAAAYKRWSDRPYQIDVLSKNIVHLKEKIKNTQDIVNLNESYEKRYIENILLGSSDSIFFPDRNLLDYLQYSFEEQIILVPLPSRINHSYNDTSSLPHMIADMLAASRPNTSVERLMRFDSNTPLNGYCDLDTKLHVRQGFIASKAKYVIVDDVCTSGNHIKSAIQKLTFYGYNVVAGLTLGITISKKSGIYAIKKGPYKLQCAYRGMQEVS